MDDARILLCYDGSRAARRTVDAVAALHPGAAVTVVTAWKPLEVFAATWGLMAAYPGDFDEEARRSAESIVHEGAERARELGLDATELVLGGVQSVSVAIVDWCTAHHPRLVAIGATGRSAIAEVVTGSVASYVLHHAPVPVLLVHDA